MRKFQLFNRYKANIWLEEIGKNLWTIKSENPEDLKYMRVIYNEDNKTIYAIDPSGGPFLAIGDKLYYKDMSLEIISISPTYIFEIKDID